MLINNSTAHGFKYTLPLLQNFREKFLPPNITRTLQPLDAGILLWLKTKYEGRPFLRAFKNIVA